MNNTTKILIGVAAVLVVICLCGAVGALLFLRTASRAVDQTINTDPAKLSEVSATIADYTLPEGFQDGTALRLAGFSMVSYTGDDDQSHIYFFQLPAGVEVDQAEMERQFQSAAGRNYGSGNSKVVDQIPATIRGQDTTLVVTEGSNSDGQTYRQVLGMFPGKGGQAMVAFERPTSSWDQAEVDAFIASIR
jgi:hypothetical protein